MTKFCLPSIPFLPFSLASRQPVITYKPLYPSVSAAHLDNQTCVSLFQPPFTLAFIIKPQCTMYSKIKTGEEKGQREVFCQCIKTRKNMICQSKTACISLYICHIGHFLYLKCSLPFLYKSKPLTKTLQNPINICSLLEVFSVDSLLPDMP